MERHADCEAFGRDAHAIYAHHVAFVLGALGRLGVPAADREDLCHEVFLVFFRRRTEYDTNRPLRPWLGGIALRVASDHRRRARFRFEIAASSEPACPRAGVEDCVAGREALAEVRRALGRLDLDQRAVFLLHELQGHAMPEIARALNAPLNTLYSRLRLGKKKLEAELGALRAREASGADELDARAGTQRDRACAK